MFRILATFLALLAVVMNGRFLSKTLHAQIPVAAASLQDSETERSIAVHLLLRDGAWRAGRLVALDGDAFTLLAGEGTERVARDTVVACLVGSTLPRGMAFLTQLTAGTLVLDDGQLLPGEFRFDGARASWQHRWIGSIPIDLDRLSEIRFRAESRASVRADADTVLLLNGDSVTGFVDSIGSDIALESLEPTTPPQSGEEAVDHDAAGSAPSSGDEPTEPQDEASNARRIPTERVAAITFAKAREVTRTGIAMWLADGTHVRADAVEFDGNRGWIFGLADPLLRGVTQQDGTRPIASSPIALVFDQDALHPLAACENSPPEPPLDGYRYAVGESVRIEDPSQSLLGLGEIAFDGCMRVRFRIPDALLAARAPFAFTAEVSLAEPAPADAAVEIVATIGGEVSARVRLDRTTRSGVLTLGEVEAPSASGTELPQLVISIADGGNGGAGDRVVLRRAMFLRTD
ncbi:MAG: hypothetical protein GC172_11650 [Phycisphaera sp.]|nr:hypothetical protein [Phycisphaera sp.]